MRIRMTFISAARSGVPVASPAYAAEPSIAVTGVPKGEAGCAVFSAERGCPLDIGRSGRSVARRRTLGRRSTVGPGLLVKGLEASRALLPRAARSRIMAPAMADMTKPLAPPPAAQLARGVSTNAERPSS